MVKKRKKSVEKGKDSSEKSTKVGYGKEIKEKITKIKKLHDNKFLVEERYKKSKEKFKEDKKKLLGDLRKLKEKRNAEKNNLIKLIDFVKKR